MCVDVFLNSRAFSHCPATVHRLVEMRESTRVEKNMTHTPQSSGNPTNPRLTQAHPSHFEVYRLGGRCLIHWATVATGAARVEDQIADGYHLMIL